MVMIDANDRELLERPAFASLAIQFPNGDLQNTIMWYRLADDTLRMIAPAESYEAKKAAFLAMLRELSPGLTQIASHPADESLALNRIASDWQQRVWDAQLMADSDVQMALHGQNIELTDWREIMRRFEGRPVAPAVSDAGPGPRGGKQ